MAMLERELIRSLTSASAGLPNTADYASPVFQSESRVQEELFSDLISSVCYWSTVILLALAGAGLLYWRVRHAGSAVAPAGDPFGITTPPWMMLSLPPLGVAASLSHAAWCAARGRRAWRMLMTAASLIAVMSATTVLERYLTAL
jgi:sirohydrochlorin ferrochelatase